MEIPVNSDYQYRDALPTHSNSYLWPALMRILNTYGIKSGSIFELGCGNGATAGMLVSKGYEVTAIDPSWSGIKQARHTYPRIHFEVGSSVDWPHKRFGQFDTVISLEVVEHCFSPKQFATAAFELAKPGGLVVISTPYHGYIKNLALALTNRFDFHFTSLWEGGHIKFFSMNTLQRLIEFAGLELREIIRVGRVPPLAKTMIAVARKPDV